MSVDENVRAGQRRCLEMLAQAPAATEKPWYSALHRNAAKVLLDRDADDGCAWFMNPANLGDPGHLHFEWHVLLLLRAYHALGCAARFRDSGAAEAVRRALTGPLLEGLRAGKGWGGAGKWENDRVWAASENHVITQFSNRLLCEQLAGPAGDAAFIPRAKAVIRNWFWEKAVRGFTEYFSPHYTERVLVPLLNLYDFAGDAELRKLAKMTVDVIFAEYAMVHLNGWRGGAMRRFYHYAGRTPCPELSNGRADCMVPAGWVFFGPPLVPGPVEYETNDNKIGYLAYATTGYRPLPAHFAVADSVRRGKCVYRSARKWEHEYSEQTSADAFIYAYITPHYVLSSIRIPGGEIWGRRAGAPAFYDCVNRGLPFRLSFLKPRAMIGPACELGGEASAAHTFSLAPPDARALFQHENLLIYSGRADSYRGLAPAIPAGEAIEHEEVHGPCRFFRESGREGETVYAGVREANGLGVMEVAFGSRWDSWGAFVRAFVNSPAELRSPEDLHYTATDGRRIALKRGRAFVNDVEVMLDDWPLYDSPFLRAAWLGQSENAGRILFGAEGIGQVELNFGNTIV